MKALLVRVCAMRNLLLLAGLAFLLVSLAGCQPWQTPASGSIPLQWEKHRYEHPNRYDPFQRCRRVSLRRR